MRVPKLTFVYDRKKTATRNKPSVVELRVSLLKERKYISTGLKLLPSEWCGESVVNRSDWNELNKQLSIIKQHCSDIITEMMEEGNVEIAAIANLLKDRLVQQNTFIEFAEECAERKYRKIKSGTKKHYELVIGFLKKWRKITAFADVTERNILRMDDELTKRGLNECSRWNYHRMVKFFIRQAVEEGLIKHNPYSRLDIRRGDENGLKKYLTPDEFHRFEHCEIPVETLARVRDLFVFQTYTMLSYSDLEKFDYENCVIYQEQVVYRSKRVKTGQDFTIMLVQPALDILKKYDNKLPIISNAKYNAYLKPAVTYAQIDKSITTHWARHTGATMLLNEGNVPMHIVQRILGHSSIRETERTYAKVMDETIVQQMVNYQNRL